MLEVVVPPVTIRDPVLPRVAFEQGRPRKGCQDGDPTTMDTRALAELNNPRKTVFSVAVDADYETGLYVDTLLLDGRDVALVVPNLVDAFPDFAK
jgi:hypothetical protein